MLLYLLRVLNKSFVRTGNCWQRYINVELFNVSKPAFHSNKLVVVRTEGSVFRVFLVNFLFCL